MQLLYFVTCVLDDVQFILLQISYISQENILFFLHYISLTVIVVDLKYILYDQQIKHDACLWIKLQIQTVIPLQPLITLNTSMVTSK